MINKFIAQAMSFAEQQHQITKELKQRAINEYNTALKMPRKKKKRAKKSALLNYSIACWGEQFNFLK
jgi:hypothetical protein